MKRVIYFVFFTIFSSKSFAQDCNCKHWKKTYLNANGDIRYEYEHKCSQPGTAWEYMGYDEAYCNELIENEKRRIEDVKKTNEAIEISKNTKKQLSKDGYKVISWYGKFLGNTGKWDNVGSPHYGINEDSTFVEWNQYGHIVIRGHIKNENLYGLLEFYENGNEYLDPKGLIQYISEYLNMGPQSWKPNVIYFNETGKYESEKESLTKGVEQTLYGIYYAKINGQKKYFSHYYIGDGFVTLFSSPIDENNASIIHNEFVKTEITKEINFIKDSYKKIEERINQKSNETKQNIVLTEFESNFVGIWNFKSNLFFKRDEGRYYFIKEQIQLNKDRTYKYVGDCFPLDRNFSPNTNPDVHTTNTGTWEVNNFNFIFNSYPSKENLPSDSLIDLISNRLKEKLKILNEIDQTNINLNDKLNIIHEKIINSSFLALAKKDENNIKMSIFYSLFKDDEILSEPDLIEEYYQQLYKLEKKKNIKYEIMFNKISHKKIIRNNINFKETLLYKLSKNNGIKRVQGIEDINILILKGKKQK
jgi:hypothetical protein